MPIDLDTQAALDRIGERIDAIGAAAADDSRLAAVERLLRRQLPGRGVQAQPLLTVEEITALRWLVDERRKAER